MEKRWKLVTIGGIPIYITVPWLFFAAFIVWATYRELASTNALTEQQAIAWSLANAALFYGSIILHELAHAVDRSRVPSRRCTASPSCSGVATRRPNRANEDRSPRS